MDSVLVVNLEDCLMLSLHNITSTDGAVLDDTLNTSIKMVINRYCNFVKLCRLGNDNIKLSIMDTV